MISYKELCKNEEIRTYIETADSVLASMGYTEHSFAHVNRVANTSKYILKTLGYDQKDIELCMIASYLHDIGNLVNRIDHAQSGAVMAFRILKGLDFTPKEISDVVSAIGNHDESTAFPVNPIAAALIIADKTDVRRSRVRNKDIPSFDIHDRVNYSVKKTSVKINENKTEILLKLDIDTRYGAVMDYFEIFLHRMILCRKAAAALNLDFKLTVNDRPMM